MRVWRLRGLFMSLLHRRLADVVRRQTLVGSERYLATQTGKQIRPKRMRVVLPPLDLVRTARACVVGQGHLLTFAADRSSGREDANDIRQVGCGRHAHWFRSQ